MSCRGQRSDLSAVFDIVCIAANCLTAARSLRAEEERLDHEAAEKEEQARRLEQEATSLDQEAARLEREAGPVSGW